MNGQVEGKVALRAGKEKAEAPRVAKERERGRGREEILPAEKEALQEAKEKGKRREGILRVGKAKAKAKEAVGATRARLVKVGFDSSIRENSIMVSFDKAYQQISCQCRYC